MVYVIQHASRIRTELPSWSCSQAVWHIPLLCVQWKIPDDGQRNCPKHVKFYSKNKFEKLLHLVGFIIRIEHILKQRTVTRLLPFLFFGCVILLTYRANEKCLAKHSRVNLLHSTKNCERRPSEAWFSSYGLLKIRKMLTASTLSLDAGCCTSGLWLLDLLKNSGCRTDHLWPILFVVARAGRHPLL